MPRRQFQVGPSRFKIVRDSDGWWVEEFYWQMDRHGEEEDCWERHGPYAKAAEVLNACMKLEGLNSQK